MDDPEVEAFIRMGYITACATRLSRRAQEKIVSEESHQVRSLLARSGHLDRDMFEALGADPHEHVRRTLAYNAATPDDVLARLAAESQTMRVAILSHDWLSPPMVRFLARYPDTYQRLRDRIQHHQEPTRVPLDLDFPPRYLQDQYPEFLSESLSSLGVDVEAWESLLSSWEGSTRNLIEAIALTEK